MSPAVDPAGAGAPPLVVRFGAFGDMIMLVPLLRALAARYGRPADVISSAPWTKPLLQSQDQPGSIRLLTSRRTPLWLNLSQWRLLLWLRTRPAGPVYVCEHDPKTYRLLRLGGVSDEWICPLPAIPRRPEEHVVEHYLRFAHLTPAALGGQPLESWVGPLPDHRLVPSAAARAECEIWLAGQGLGQAAFPLVLIQPGNKKTMRRGDPQRASNIKYWSPENWAAVIRGVCATLPEARVLVCGTAEEHALVGSIVGTCAEARVLNVAGQLPIPRLLALLARAHSMISVDTGPSHAATAVGCPVVVLILDDMLVQCGPRSTTAPTATVVAPSLAGRGSYPLAGLIPAAVLEAWRSLPEVFPV
jgi:heptosyltransferase-2/heptosyltransferase-3